MDRPIAEWMEDMTDGYIPELEGVAEDIENAHRIMSDMRADMSANDESMYAPTVVEVCKILKSVMNRMDTMV